MWSGESAGDRYSLLIFAVWRVRAGVDMFGKAFDQTSASDDTATGLGMLSLPRSEATTAQPAIDLQLICTGVAYGLGTDRR